MGNNANLDDAVRRCLNGLLESRDCPNLKKWKENFANLCNIIPQALNKAWDANPACRAPADIPADSWEARVWRGMLDWVEGSPKQFYEACEKAVNDSLAGQCFAATAVQDKEFRRGVLGSRQPLHWPASLQIDVPAPGPKPEDVKHVAEIQARHEAEIQREYVQFLRDCLDVYMANLDKTPKRAFEITAIYLSFIIRHLAQHHSNVRISFKQLAEWFGFSEGNLRQRCWRFMKDVKARLAKLKQGDHS